MTTDTMAAAHDGKPGDRPRCGALTRGGTPCTQAAGWGTQHVGYGRCKLHGGRTQSHIIAAEKAIAKSAVTKLGLPRVIEPQAALLEELHRSAGAVAWLDLVVGELGLGDVMWGQTKATVDGAVYEAGTSVWVREWNTQRRHYLEVAKACVSAGIAEQRIQLEQDQARMVAVAVSEGLDAIGADPGQREVFTRVLLARMRLVDGSTVAGEVEA